MRILIIGGSGFLGTHLARELSEHTIFSASRSSSLRLELGEPASIRAAFEKARPELVYHLASTVKHELGEQTVRDQLEGMRHVLASCSEHGVRKLIFTSSMWVYGNQDAIPTPESASPKPATGYARLKLEEEKAIKAAGVPHAILRLGNLYGPGGSNIINAFIRKALAREPLPVHGSGEQTRDYLYVADAAEALAACASKGNGTINIGSGTETSVNALIDELGRQLGLRPATERTPAQPGDILRSCLDCSLAKRTLGWQARTSLSEGIRKTIQQLRTSPSS